MSPSLNATIVRTVAGLCLTLLALTALAQWTTPTPEELSMTSQPEVPGAAAVYLYREETSDDDQHGFSTYIRIKVLTEKGKDYRAPPSSSPRASAPKATAPPSHSTSTT
jgi:hypothetical protein